MSGGVEVQNTVLTWHQLLVSALLVLIPSMTPSFWRMHGKSSKYQSQLPILPISQILQQPWSMADIREPKPLLTLLNVPFTTSSCIWQCGYCNCLLKSSSTARCLRSWLHSCLAGTMGRTRVTMLRGVQGKQVNCWHLLLLYWDFYSESYFHLVFLFHRLEHYHSFISSASP